MDIRKLDLSRPLGKGAVTLDFMAVSVHMIFGVPVAPKNLGLQSILNMQKGPSVFYTQEDHCIFDRADVDEAILKEIAKSS